MFDMLNQVLNRWASQDVARKNAGRASVRMQHRRREREEILGFLNDVPHAPDHAQPLRPPDDPVRRV
jgi:hypothetical protein